MFTDLQKSTQKSTVDSSMDLENELQVPSSVATYCCPGISRIREGLSSRAVQQRQCKHAQ